MDLICSKSSDYTEVHLIYIFTTLYLNDATSVMFTTQAVFVQWSLFAMPETTELGVSQHFNIFKSYKIEKKIGE